MRVYIGNTGHIKNHQNFKILFWSRESEKPIFTIFPDFFTKKWAGNLGISSETTWESRVKRPGSGGTGARVGRQKDTCPDKFVM